MFITMMKTYVNACFKDNILLLRIVHEFIKEDVIPYSRRKVREKNATERSK